MIDPVANRPRYAEYDAQRDIAEKEFPALCYAPFVSVFFRADGNVRACCHNWSRPLGNILNTSFDELWNGARAIMLRESLMAYEFPAGCERCKWQTQEGLFGNTTMRNFDRFTLDGVTPRSPRQMEFSIGVTCNLECVMCNGTHSSAIRAQREKLPPLKCLYTDEILHSLRKHFPYLHWMKFLGGEPFLIEEHYHIWRMLVEDGLSTPCHVTTNGTVYNSRVENVLDELPFSFSVSMDGATRSTVESIRVNSSYDTIMHNIHTFLLYTRERGTSLSLTFCLMRQNWHEFGEYCLFADELDCHVGVNTVTDPPQFGVYTLPKEDLRVIARALERQAVALDSQLKRNHAVFFNELARLQAKSA